jgi:hypothetical protein
MDNTVDVPNGEAEAQSILRNFCELYSPSFELVYNLRGVGDGPETKNQSKKSDLGKDLPSSPPLLLCASLITRQVV